MRLPTLTCFPLSLISLYFYCSVKLLFPLSPPSAVYRKIARATVFRPVSLLCPASRHKHSICSGPVMLFLSFQISHRNWNYQDTHPSVRPSDNPCPWYEAKSSDHSNPRSGTGQAPSHCPSAGRNSPTWVKGHTPLCLYAFKSRFIKEGILWNLLQ